MAGVRPLEGGSVLGQKAAVMPRLDEATAAPRAARSAEDLEALRQRFEAARRDRLTHLGVSEEAVAASALTPGTRQDEAQGTLRVMQYNLLADGLSDDGFLLRPVLREWPAGPGMVPTAGGDPVPFQQLLDEIKAAKGNEEALRAVQARFADPAVERNARAVLDWRAREAQLALTVLAAGRPDVLIFQEVDHFKALAESLSAIGYASQLPGKRGAYVPAHLEGHTDRTKEGRDCLRREWLDAGGHTFLPGLGSTCLGLALRGRGLHKKILQAAEAQGRLDAVAGPKAGTVKKGVFCGLPGGSRKLLVDPGAEDLAELDDDGVAVFWRTDRLEALSMQAHFTEGGKGFLEVQLRTLGQGRLVTVFGAHLSSGGRPADEQERLSKSVDVAGGLADLVRWRRQAAAAARGAGDIGGQAAVVLALDANAHPQLRAPGGEASVWRSLRRAAGASVWDAHFDEAGDPLKAVSADLGLQPAVTSNKMRGPESAQPRKIGEHAYVCIDHVFFDPSAFRAATHVLPPRRFPSTGAALEELQPSLGNPSDHYPVVVDLAFA